MKRLSLLAFTLILSCGHRSNDKNSAFPIVDDGKTVVDDSNRGGSSVPQLTSCYQGDAWTCAVEAAVVAKTNAYRSGAGRKSLAQSFETSFVARVHSLDMVARNTLDHAGFRDGKRLVVLQANFPDLKFFFSAENVAWIPNRLTDPEAVAQELVESWWGSTGHRENMLAEHTYLGVGVARSKDRIYATQLFH